MRKYLITTLMVLLFAGVKAQNAQTQIRQQSFTSDSNAVVYDEQGNALRYYQYSKMISSGNYTLRSDGPPGTPGTKQSLIKLTPELRARVFTTIKPMLTISSGPLGEGNTLDVNPLLKQLKLDNLDGKALVLVFWAADCTPCTGAFSTLNNDFKQTDIVTIAITADSKGVAERQLKETPLTASYLLNNAGKIFSSYGVFKWPTYIVTDKTHVIKFALAGNSPFIIPALGDAIKGVASK